MPRYAGKMPRAPGTATAAASLVMVLCAGAATAKSATTGSLNDIEHIIVFMQVRCGMVGCMRECVRECVSA